MNKKGMVKSFVFLALSMMTLSGCSNNSKDNTGEGEEVTKLVFWSGATKGNKDQEYEEELIKKYAQDLNNSYF